MFRLPLLIYKNKFALPPLPPAGTFKNQTILITGASGGIGLAAAVHFVNLGASRVIITARTAAKGEAAKSTIETRTHTVGKDVVKVMELDMSTFAETRDFAERVKREVKSIDYVLLNAGLINTKFKLGKEGFEETIQVNCLSTALLAILLLPWIKEAGKGKAHLGFVTSGLHRDVDIAAASWPKENIFGFFSKEENFPKALSPWYPESKLLEQYVVNEIAKLAVGKDGKPDVIVHPMCPGLVKSDLSRASRTSFLMSLAVDLFMNLIAKSTEGGARTLVLAGITTSEENGRHVTHYQSDEDYKKATVHNIGGTAGQKMQAAVWKETLEILEARVPEVRNIVHSPTA